jgi:hypothetical protein
MKADEGGAQPASKPVTGTFKVPHGERIPHHQGFDHAFDAALKQLGWRPGQHGATVQFTARINVTNPGQVGEYGVTLIPL